MNVSTNASLATTLAAGPEDGLASAAAAKSGSGTLNVASRQDATADDGDTVSISAEGLALAAKATQAASNAGAAVGSSSADGTDETASTAISDSLNIDGGALVMTGSDSAGGASGESTDTSDVADSTYEKVLKEIQKLQQQIKEVQDDPSLTEEQKRAKVQELEQQLLTMESQLLEAKAKSAGDPLTYKGGTRAKFASSLTGA